MATKKALTKAQIIKQLTEATKLKGVQVRAVIDGLFDSKKGIVSKALQGKRPVAIAGFGKFYLHRKKAVKGGKREVFGKVVTVKAKPATDVPKFRFAKAIKDSI